ncbi:MAG: topoisomerase IV [Clostridia bacterium]|nr:topoisomerase IV [Clostridia bacterium]
MNFTEQKIGDVLEQNYMPYAMSVIVSRAIPEIDGFKPSHRKLLYTMHKMNLLTGNRSKSTNVVGRTMQLNPHGDAAIYETMVRLTVGNGALLHPFVDSKGNFGKQYSRDMAYAAARYTEVKLDSICKEVFGDIDKDAVDFVDNFDATLKEPVLIPVKFPNILVNPNEGIAVGMASKICSFNLREICEATIALMRDEKADLLPIIQGPDFPGGGEILYNQEAMREIYETGRGSFKIRGTYNYDKKNNVIEITEIPYTTNLEVIIEKVVEGIKAGKYREITDIRDETDLKGLKIAIDVKKSADVEKLMAQIYKNTTLLDTFSCNFNVLIDGMPKVLGVRGLLLEWIRFRVGCVKRILAFDLKKKEDRLHLLRGLEKILLDIDKAIRIIRETEKADMVVPGLMKGFNIDEIQAEFVAEIKLRNLNKEYILKSIAAVADLEREIEDLKTTLSSERRIKKLISKELEDIAKKYGKGRISRVIPEEEGIVNVQTEVYVEDYALKLFLTEEGYLKKVSLVSLRSSGEHKLKENDRIVQVEETSNKNEVLLFSDQCNVYKMRINDIPDCKVSSMGEYTPNLLAMQPNEKIISIVPTSDYSGFMFFGYADGRTCKVPVKAYVTKNNRKMLANAYSDHAPLVKAIFIPEDTDMVAYGSNEKAMVFNTAQVPEKATRSAQGVKTFNPGKRGTMINLRKLSEAGLADTKGYRARNLPAAGNKLSAEDKSGEQLTLF